MVVYKYYDALITSVGNWVQTSHEASMEMGPCMCSHPSMERYRQPGGHVVTKDLSIITDPALRELLAKGPTLRMRPAQLYVPKAGLGGRTPTAWDLLMYCIEGALDSFINKQEETHEIPGYHFAPWRSEVMAAVQEAIPDGSLTPEEEAEIEHWRSADPKNPGWSDDTHAALRKLQKHFVFTVADKETGIFCLSCKKHWIETVRADLEKGDTYVLEGDGAAAAWEARRDAIDFRCTACNLHGIWAGRLGV